MNKHTKKVINPIFEIYQDEIMAVLNHRPSQYASLTFFKRGNGQQRVMTVTLKYSNPDYKGVGMGYNPEEKGLIQVLDNRAHKDYLKGKAARDGFKCVPLDGITKIRKFGIDYRVIS